MTDIFHQVGVTSSLEETFEAINTLSGLSSWWTKCTGDTSIGSRLHFHFGEHKVEMTVEKSVADKEIVWRCTDKDGEWQNTQISYQLVPTDEQTLINFSHTGWRQQSELCSLCNTKWAVILVSLKQYLETGKGQPFPKDIQINHTNG